MCVTKMCPIKGAGILLAFTFLVQYSSVQATVALGIKSIFLSYSLVYAQVEVAIKWNVTPLIFEVGEDIPLQHILPPKCSFYPPSSY